MVDISNEVNAVYHRKVGELVCKLAEKVDMLRIGKSHSVLGEDMLMLRITRVRGSSTANLEEMFNRRMIEDINDIDVIVNAMIEKLTKK